MTTAATARRRTDVPYLIAFASREWNARLVRQAVSAATGVPQSRIDVDRTEPYETAQEITVRHLLPLDEWVPRLYGWAPYVDADPIVLDCVS